MKRKFNIVYVCLLHELLVFNLNENDWKCIQMNKDDFNKLLEETHNSKASLK